jgi:putative oxidoreductase
MDFNKALLGHTKIEATWPNAGLLLLRLYAGITIMLAGLDKLPLTDWMTDQVVAMGFPFPVFFAWVASFSEFAFGLLLTIGLMTRISALFLAITMGVAAFAFQGVLPFLNMHISQHYFWIYILFLGIGGGRYAADYWLSQAAGIKHSVKTALPMGAFAILLMFGLYREFVMPKTQPVATKEENLSIASVHVTGSFSQWDPAANPMQKTSAQTYETTLNFAQPGPIEFKFTANQSWDNSLGAVAGQKGGFPIKGKALPGANAANIKGYIPAAGSYVFQISLDSLSFSVDSLQIR